jgi:hypothetical protein
MFGQPNLLCLPSRLPPKKLMLERGNPESPGAKFLQRGIGARGFRGRERLASQISPLSDVSRGGYGREPRVGEAPIL